MRTYLVVLLALVAVGLLCRSLVGQPAKLTKAEEKARIATLVDGIAAREAILQHVAGVVSERVWEARQEGTAAPPSPIAAGPMVAPGMPGPTAAEADPTGAPRPVGAITAFWLRGSEGFSDYTAYGGPPVSATWHRSAAMAPEWLAEIDYTNGAASVRPAANGSCGYVLGAGPYRSLAVVGDTQVPVWREWLQTDDEALRPTIRGHETVNGVPCDIMCFQNKIGRLRFWVAPTQGYCIMRSDELYWEAGPGQFGSYRIEERSDVADLGHGVFVPRCYQRQVYRFKPYEQPQWQWASTWEVRLSEVSTDVADRRLPDLRTLIPASFAVADTRGNRLVYTEPLLKEMRKNPPPEPEHLLAPGQQPSMDRIPQAQP